MVLVRYIAESYATLTYLSFDEEEGYGITYVMLYRFLPFAGL